MKEAGNVAHIPIYIYIYTPCPFECSVMLLVVVRIGCKAQIVLPYQQPCVLTGGGK